LRPTQSQWHCPHCPWRRSSLVRAQKRSPCRDVYILRAHSSRWDSAG
jgi:hypothetical protein